MICLTFDTDHMDEAGMAQFVDAHTFPGSGTFFCTRQFLSLSGSRHEVAPHPFLAPGADWTTELLSMRQMFPDAVGWRSHSCVFSHLLARWLGENGYTYVSVDERFGQPDIHPARHPLGTVWQIPIYYMDTFDISRQMFWKVNETPPFDKTLILQALATEGIYVFDFHPVHVMLNTPHPHFYFSTRERYRAGETYQQLRYQGYGVGIFFQELCDQLRVAEVQSVRMAEALTAYIDKWSAKGAPSAG
jgi:hypothetical protein